jgi:hypothetical protein
MKTVMRRCGEDHSKSKARRGYLLVNHRHTIVVTGRTIEAIPYVACSELVIHDV